MNSQNASKSTDQLAHDLANARAAVAQAAKTYLEPRLSKLAVGLTFAALLANEYAKRLRR